MENGERTYSFKKRPRAQTDPVVDGAGGDVNK